MFGNLNWKDLAEIKEKEKFVLLFPIGSTESHGPHCPLATDAIICLESSVLAAEKLRTLGYEAYVLPPLTYTVAECARNFPGTISISEETECVLITEICLQLINQGMSKICIVNNHGEPGNVRAIYTAIEKIHAKTGVKLLFPNRLRKKYVVRLPECFRKGETHADRYETSLILAIDPSLVNEERRRNLPYIPINLVEKLFKEHLNEFKAMGMPECYCGDPASASAEEGEKTLGILRDIIVESVEEMFQGKPIENEMKKISKRFMK
jgi:creatinine amidohydrolase